ncbi:uncharacterized protein METZ01_LOCUS313432, partial [marine metagenome]
MMENRYIDFCRVIIGKILIAEESIKLFTTFCYLPRRFRQLFILSLA